MAITEMAQRPGAAREGLLARHPLVFYFILACAGSWLVALTHVRFADGTGRLPFSWPFGSARRHGRMTMSGSRLFTIFVGFMLGLALGCGPSRSPVADDGGGDGPAAKASLADSEKRAAALTEAIHTGMKRASIPGAIVGVWREGQPPYVRAFGVRDTASGEPMTTDLSMRIGSNSRAFTVTALLQLVDQGKLRLDDPIDKYVAGVPNGKEITLRHLAAMRSGLYNYTDELIPKLPKG